MSDLYDFEVGGPPAPAPPTPAQTRVMTLRALGMVSTGGLREFHRILAAQLERDKPRLVIDMAEIQTLDSGMLSLLITALRTARERGGDLSLCKFQPEVRVTMDYLKLDRVFNIHESEVEARNRMEMENPG